MKIVHVSGNFNDHTIPVTNGELVKVVHGRKAVIVTFIRSGDRHCSECCFDTGGSGLCQLGLYTCSGIPASCMSGYFKRLDDTLENL